MEVNNPYSIPGLTTEQVIASRDTYGANKIDRKKVLLYWNTFIGVVTEPMFILLVAASIIYFLMGEYSDAWFMLGAIIIVSAISIYQENRSKNALNSLKELSQPHATVIRNNQVILIRSEEVVMGDFVVISQGEIIPADGIVRQLNDFSVIEAILTGESLGVTKEIDDPENNKIFGGTLVESGQCIFEVSAIGIQTKIGQLGKAVDEIKREKTPLQRQINHFVKWMVLVGAIIFLIIWGINYIKSNDILDSLLKGLTIAMSVLPEEIPVAFATFMAIGAWRMIRKGVIVKETSTMESLGAATILCADKTGTITENRMELFQLYDFKSDRIIKEEQWKGTSSEELISAAMWASETVPFDRMEKSIHETYSKYVPDDERPHFKMIHEYPIGGKPPMMTHLFENESGKRIIAMKGAPEAIIHCSDLSKEQKLHIEKILEQFAVEGLRVLGVGVATFEGDQFPEKQQDFSIQFLGLLGFYDPPKKDIAELFQNLYKAGLQVKIITGDNPITTAAIARQADFYGYEKSITSDQLKSLEGELFDKAVNDHYIFTRMFPELKLKIIESLKKQQHVVIMTGDGVNDGPALKAANIGFAMGKNGSEVAKDASSLILVDDDVNMIYDSIAMGRRIYTNLKKSIQYIISIHIPIILIVAIPLILGWIYPTIFTPVHVIFLELIMGPTCSIVYENEPLEKNSMLYPPRTLKDTFFNMRELTISIIQGLLITAGTLVIYQIAVQHGYNEETTRSMVFTTLIFANIFLTLVNRSFYHSVFSSFRNKNNLMLIILLLTLLLQAIILYFPPVSAFFKVTALNVYQLILTLSIALISVGWFEIYKWIRRKHVKQGE